MPSVLWRSLVLLLASIFVFLPKTPAETQPWRPPAPEAEELEELEELAQWIEPSAVSSLETGTKLPRGLRQAISERRSSFRMFRAFNDHEAHRRRLEDLPFGDEIYEAASSQGIDPLLLAAVVQAESNFSPNVVSPVGAIGLTQVMPSTAAAYSPEELAQPRTNLKLGARYLKEQLERFGGNLELAIAAYNAGPYAVARYEGIPPYRETRNYVEKVLAIYVGHHRSLWQGSVISDLLQSPS